MNEVIIFDLEADGLKPTKIYVISYENEKGEIHSLTDYSKMKELFLNAKVVICHNCIRFDVPVLERILGIEIKAQLIDTLALSWYLYPQRSKHGLESWGYELGPNKTYIESWFNLPLEKYIERCENDVKINSRLWYKMKDYLQEIYGSQQNYERILKYLSFKMKCAQLQEKNGWDIDVEHASEALEELKELRERKVFELQAAMPKVPIKKIKSKPKRFINQNGSVTKLGQAWIDLLIENDLPLDYENDIEIIDGYSEPNPKSTDQLKSWLYELGWKPQTFKHTKNSKGELKSIPQINLPEGKGVCDSIKILFEKEPALEALDGLSILNHRIPLLEGILNSVEDGKSKAQVAGLTNTLRFKHSTIVNLPRVNRPYAEAVRGSLIALKGYLLCGSDMSSLEDRIKQHFIYPHDPEYVDSMNLPDFDPHLIIAELAGMLTNEQVTEYKAGDKKNKPIRDIAKNGNYACQYGAGVPRLMITCGIDREAATKLHEAYWRLNWAVKAVAKEQKFKTVQNQMWLFNPVSKMWYSLRNEKDIFSTLVQGTAAYVFDFWLGEVLKWDKNLIGQFHDEFIFRIEIYEKEWFEKKIRNSINVVNNKLNLNRELGCDVQFGERYSEIH